jgi:hypothetical protein
MQTPGELVSEIRAVRDKVIDAMARQEIDLDQYREAVGGLNQARAALDTTEQETRMIA